MTLKVNVKMWGKSVSALLATWNMPGEFPLSSKLAEEAIAWDLAWTASEKTAAFGFFPKLLSKSLLHAKPIINMMWLILSMHVTITTIHSLNSSEVDLARKHNSLVYIWFSVLLWAWRRPRVSNLVCRTKLSGGHGHARTESPTKIQSFLQQMHG